mgnify:CR=1 FL=1
MSVLEQVFVVVMIVVVEIHHQVDQMDFELVVSVVLLVEVLWMDLYY